MPSGNRRPLYTPEDLKDIRSVPDAPVVVASPSSLPTVVSSTPAAEVPKDVIALDQPCTIKGLASAAGAGALGYFFGFVPGIIKHKARKWGLIHAEGLKSAQQLAIMSGLYTAVHCICQRVRQTEDGWNRGIAGCATGLALGWQGGPWSAAQSCVGLGVLSYVLDFAQAAPAQAAVMTNASLSRKSASVSGERSDLQRHILRSFDLGLHQLALPPLMWLGHCCNGQIAEDVRGCKTLDVAASPRRRHPR